MRALIAGNMKRRFLPAALIAAGAVWIGVGAAESDDALSLRVSPPASLAPGEIYVSVGVEPNAENRVLRVEADSGLFFRASEIPLDGAEAPPRHWLQWSQLPAGSYEVIATLRGSGGTRAVARELVRIYTADELTQPQ